MSIKLYMDVHVPYAVTLGLRLRGIDVLTAQDDRTTTLPDALLLDRATALSRAPLHAGRRPSKKKLASGRKTAGNSEA